MDTNVLQSMLSYKKKGNGLLVDMIIDKLTPCLTHRVSQEHYDTSVKLFTQSDFSQVHEWQFRWNEIFSNLEFQNAEAYKLFIKGQNRIEGLICLEPDENFIFVHLVESAPWNIGSTTKEFIGVGAHLFAVACKKSFELGFDGYVCFEAKTKLMNHDQDSLGAYRISSTRMAIDTESARVLVATYF